MATIEKHGPIETWGIFEDDDGTKRLRLRPDETHILQEFEIDAETAEQLADDLQEHIAE